MLQWGHTRLWTLDTIQPFNLNLILIINLSFRLAETRL